MQEIIDAPSGPETPYSLTRGETLTGALSFDQDTYGETDWIAVDLVADTVAFFEATWDIEDQSQERYDLSLYMRTQAGVWYSYAEFDRDSGNWILAFRPEESGRYYLDLGSSDNNEGTYSVTWTGRPAGVEGADASANAATAYSLTDGQPLQGYLGGLDQGDWVHTSLAAGQIYDLSISLDAYDLADRNYDRYLEGVVVEIRDAAGELVREIEVDNSATLTLAATEAMEAFITIRQADTADKGGYTLDLSAGRLVAAATYAEAVDYLGLGYWRDYGAALNAQDVARDPDAILVPLPTLARAFVTQERSIEVDTSQLNAEQSSVLFGAMQVWTDATGLEFYEGNTSYSLYPNAPAEFVYSGQIGVALNSSGSGVSGATRDGTLLHSIFAINETLLTANALEDPFIMDRLVQLIGRSIGVGNLSAPAADGSAFSINGGELDPQVFQFDGPQASVMRTRGADQNAFLDYTSAPVAGPMTLDILAIEHLYGAGPGTMLGDTVWGVGTTIANASASLFEAFASGTGQAVFYTIADDGGVDVLSFAGSDKANRIDLGPGMFSDIAGTVGTLTIMSDSMIETAIGGEAGDDITGNTANNRLEGRGGDDILRGLGGTDTLIGGAGNDTLIGGTSVDDLRDLILGGDGDDIIDGGYGNDELRGDAGNDIMAGGFGADTVIGGTGNDVMTGSALSDLLYGGDGMDFVNGGYGHDRVNGGDGADRFFHVGAHGHGSDWIQDYDAAEGDTLLFGIGSADGDDFLVNYAHTASAAGERSGDDAVAEAFVIYIPTGQIMWALVDGAAQTSIDILIGGVTYDLLV